MRNIFLLLFPFIFFLSCENDTSEYKTINNPHRQLGFTLVDTVYNFIESNDIGFIVETGFEFPSDKPDSCLVSIYSTTTKRFEFLDGSYLKNYGLTFKFWALKEEIYNNTVEAKLDIATIEKAFKEGEANFLIYDHPDSIGVGLHVGFNHRLGNHDFISFYPYSSFGASWYQDNESYFIIENTELADHSLLGNCILISGIFNITTYFHSITGNKAEPYEESYKLENGTFQLLIPGEKVAT